MILDTTSAVTQHPRAGMGESEPGHGHRGTNCSRRQPSIRDHITRLDHGVARLDGHEAIQVTLDDVDWPSGLAELKLSSSHLGGDRKHIFALQRANPDHCFTDTGYEPEHPQVDGAIVKSQRGTAMQCSQETSLMSFFMNDSMGLLICSLYLQKAKILPRIGSFDGRTRRFDCGHTVKIQAAHHHAEANSFNLQDRQLLDWISAESLLRLECADEAATSRLDGCQACFTINCRPIIVCQRGGPVQSVHLHLQMQLQREFSTFYLALQRFE